MGELLLIAVGAALVNNFVLVQFLGVCPFMGGSRRIEGAIGMGLAIAKGIVEAHGGRIWIEDAKTGPGARLVFTVPVGDDESREDAHVVRTNR